MVIEITENKINVHVETEELNLLLLVLANHIFAECGANGMAFLNKGGILKCVSDKYVEAVNKIKSVLQDCASQNNYILEEINNGSKKQVIQNEEFFKIGYFKIIKLLGLIVYANVNENLSSLKDTADEDEIQKIFIGGLNSLQDALKKAFDVMLNGISETGEKDENEKNKQGNDSSD